MKKEHNQHPTAQSLRRVCLVTETYFPEINGVANTLKFLVEGMQQQGIEVLIIRPKQHAQDKPILKGTSQVLSLPGLPIPGYRQLKFGLPFRRRIQRAMQAFSAEAVYIATEGPLGLAALRAARKLDLGVVSGFHTNFHQYFEHYHLAWLRGLVFRYLRAFHNATDCTLVPSPVLAEELKAQGFRNIQIMARGVNSELFNPQKRSDELRQSWGINKQSPVLLYVGRLAGEKNVQLAFAGFTEFKHLQPDCRFVLVGDGPARETLEKNYPDCLFVGEKRGEELARYYASGDIFIFPSITDTYGNVVPEAMASGLHVLAFNYAAAGLLIHHEENGSLARWQSETDFLLQLKQIAQAWPTNRKVGALARKTCEDLSWNAICEQFIGHLTQVSEVRRHGSAEKPLLVSKI